MAIDFVCGWECGLVVVGAAATPSANHWMSVSGTAAISTATVRTGTRSMRCLTDITVTQTSYIQRSLAAGRRITVGRVYFRFAQFPAADENFATSRIALNQDGSITCKTSGQITIQAGTTAEANLGTPISLDTWYRLDWKYDTSTGTSSLKARLDGGTEVESTFVQAAVDQASIRLGFQSISYGELFFDDFILGDATGDYPFGSGTVEGLHPDSDGTHSFTAADFGYNTAGGDVATSATDVWSYVDDADLSSTADLIRQKVVRSTGYVEVGFQNPASTRDAQAVNVVSSWHASTTGANTVGLKLNDGGTIVAVTDTAGDGLSDFSQTTIVFDSKVYTTAPSGGAWTNAKLSALKARAGYATDVIGIPYWDGITLEVAFADRVPYFRPYPQLLAH